ncbi:lipopolysaccharide biosynthesis protein [Methylobacterium sp. JK268]
MSSIARQSVANAVASGAILIGGTLSTIAAARLLGPERLGVVTYGAWLVSIALMVADLGIPGALARYVPDLRQRGEDGTADGLTRLLFRRFLLSACLTAATLAGTALWLGRGGAVGPVTPDHYLSNPIFWLLVAGAILGQSASGFTVGLLRGRQEFGRMARVMLAAALIQVAVSTLGAVVLGVTGAMLGGIAVGLAPALFLCLALRRGGAPVPAELRQRVRRYCQATWASYLLAAIVWTRTEIFFLERSWGSGAVALFSVGVTLANLAVQLPLLLTGSLLPHFAQHIAAGDQERAVALYRTSMRVLAMMVFPACLGVVAIAPALVPLLYGDGFAGAVLPTAILVGASALSALTSVAQTFMNASERNGFNVAVGAVSAVGVILSGLTLVPAYGLLAAAAARTAIQLCSTAACLLYVERRLAAPAPLAALARLLAAAALCAAAAHAVVRAVPGPGAVLIAIPVGMLTYALGLKLFGCIGEAERRLLQSVTDALPRPAARVMSGAVRFYG